VIVLQCSFVYYAPGDSFQRRLMPGLGESQASVKTTLADGKHSQPVANVITSETLTVESSAESTAAVLCCSP
jgi:hypothetical protein